MLSSVRTRMYSTMDVSIALLSERAPPRVMPRGGMPGEIAAPLPLVMARLESDDKFAIAEDALALLDAFVEEDFEELAFRALLMSTHAECVGSRALTEAADLLLAELRHGGPPGRGVPSVHIVQRVIAAAAGVVAGPGAL